jgi:peptide/nickel transport system substrate-binding protein
MTISTRSTTWRVAAAVAALALLAAACGDDDDSTSGGATTTGGAATTTAAGGSETTASSGTTSGSSAPSATGDTTASGGSTEGTDLPEIADADLDLDATLNVTTDGPPTLLDPHQEPTQGVTPYWTPLYDTLTDINIAGEVNPRLATSWEYSDDGLSLVFQLRDDATFHDGTPVDAAAVKASLDRARTLEKSTMKNLLTSVADVQASGPNEVSLTLSTFDRSLPSVLGTAAGAVINPKAVAAGTDLTATSDGSGPYVVTEFVPNEKVTYARAEDENWDPTAGKLGGFTLSVLTDYQVALNGLQAGQYDLIRLNGLGAQITQATDSGDFTAARLGPLQTLSFWLNVTDPALKDERVRQAFAYALDRDAIVQAVFDQGSECQAQSQMYPFPGDDLYVEDYDPYHYDPAKAKQLLEEADAVGTSVLITDIGATNTGNLMQAAQPMLEAAGFKVELARGAGAAVATGFQQNQFQIAVIPNSRQPSADITLNRYWLTTGPYHLAQGIDQEIVASMDKLDDPKLSDDEVHAGYEDIAKQLAALAALVPACTPTWSLLGDNNIVNVDPRTVLLNMRVVGVKKG